MAHRRQRLTSRATDAPEPSTSAAIVEELRRLTPAGASAQPAERLAPDEPAFGVRMRELFDLAKTHRDVPLGVVDGLLDHPAYEPRLTAVCILDFKARGRPTDEERHALYELYLRRHDRITSWGMVDRAAPWVVGGYLAGRDHSPLQELTAAASPLQRRTAITAPLYFVKHGSDTDFAGGFAVAERLADDPEPTVHNAVGIFLKHAGRRDGVAQRRFLDDHAATMPRHALRLAVAALTPTQRDRYLHAGNRR